MAVVHCEEVTDRSGTNDKLGNKRYTRTFQILTDSPTDGAKQVIEYGGAPDYGDPWQQIGMLGDLQDQDPDAVVVEKRASQNDRGMFHNWTLTVEYAGRGDPTTEPPEISWSCVKYQVAVQEDVNGNAYANSAGDPFEGGMMVDRTRFTAMIRKNVLTYDPLAVSLLLDTLNDAPFLVASHPPGFAIGTCKLSELNADAVWYEDLSGVHYWKRQAKIEVDVLGWKARPLDAGFRKIQGSTQVPIVVPGGRPSSPVPLDGSGGVLALASPPVFLEFNGYSQADWSTLNLEY